MTTATSRVIPAGLRPDDAHAAFRAVLDALSRPGSVARLPAGPLDVLPAVLVPVLALADLGTGVCVLEDDGQWADAVTLATNAPAVALDAARLVAATRPVTVAEIRTLCRGSAAAPEDGALACVPVTDVDGGGATWRLAGPGVDGWRPIRPAGLPADFVEARADALARFPAGVDILLVAPDGRILGLPRSTAVVEED